MRPLCIYKKWGSEYHACVPFQGKIKKFVKLATQIFSSLCICVIMKRTWRSLYVYGVSYYCHVLKMTAAALSPNIMIKCRSNIPTLLLLLAGKSPQLRDWSRSIRFFSCVTCQGVRYSKLRFRHWDRNLYLCSSEVIDEQTRRKSIPLFIW